MQSYSVQLGGVLTANSELVARPLAISGAVGKIANVGKIAEPVGKIALAFHYFEPRYRTYVQYAVLYTNSVLQT